jgi:archaellum component FlaC
MSTDKERLASLEANINFIKEEVSYIRHDVKDLVGWKWRMAGAGAVIAAIVSYLVTTIVH